MEIEAVEADSFEVGRSQIACVESGVRKIDVDEVAPTERGLGEVGVAEGCVADF